MAQIGFPSLILIVIVAFIVFGPTKLPEVGKAVGKTLKEFKDAMNNSSVSNEDEINTPDEKNQK